MPAKHMTSHENGGSLGRKNDELLHLILKYQTAWWIVQAASGALGGEFVTRCECYVVKRNKLFGLGSCGQRTLT